MTAPHQSLLGTSGAVAEEETDPNFNETVLLLHGDGTNGEQNNTFVDSSSNNHTITRNGDTNQGTFSPFSLEDGYWSNFFTVNNSYMSLTSTAALQLSGVFTVECWVYLNSLTTDGGPHPSILTFPSNGSYATQLYLQSSNNYVGWYYNGNVVNTTNNSISKNTWHHIAVARDSSNQIALWLDGTRISSLATGQSTSYGNTSGTFYIGSLSSTTGELDGYISNVRIVKGYDVYGTTNTSISVPTTPLTAVTGTSLLTCQSNRFIDNSSSPYTLTVGSGQSVQPFSPIAPSRSYSESVVGGSAYFDGADDYLEIASSSEFVLGTNNFTIEFWVYFLDTGSASFYNIEATNGVVFYYDGTQFVLGQRGSSTTYLTYTVTLTLNTWHHVALCRDGTGTNETCLFYDGTRVQQATVSNNFSTQNKLEIGDISGLVNYDLNGYLSSYRVVNGSSVYSTSSSSITVPTTPLTSTGSDTKLLLNFTNAGIIDHTMKNNLETEGNAQIDTSVKKFGTGSIEFDGNGDELHNKFVNTLLYMGTGDFTAECFFYSSANQFDGSPGDLMIYIGSGSKNAIWVALDSGGIVRGNVGYNGSSWAVQLGSTTTISNNTWYHVALERYNGTLKLFINGTSEASSSNSTNLDSTYGGNVSLGYQYTLSRYFNGYLDEVRITKAGRYQGSNFTAPTKAFANR